MNANQKVGNYWIRVKGLGNCRYMNVSELAILNYNGQDLPSPQARDKLDYQNLIVRGKVTYKTKNSLKSLYKCINKAV